MKINSLKKYIIVGVLAGANTISFAQVSQQSAKDTTAKATDKERAAVAEEVEVVRSYKPVLADAVKIRRSPDLDTRKTFKPNLKYNLLDKRFEQNSEIKQLDAQSMFNQEDLELQNNFAKFGVGNLGTTLGALHVGTGRDEALQAGFNFNHWAVSNGDLNQQKMAGQDVGLYGRSIGDIVVLEGKLNYNRRSSYFYGIDPEGSFVNDDPVKQRFNFFEAEGEIYNRIDPYDDSKLAYAAKVNGSLFGNKFEGKESTFVLSGGISKNLSKFQLGVNSVLDFTSTKDRAYGSFKNNLFKLNPFIKIDGEKFKLTAGVNYVNQFGDNSESYLYPKASLDFTVVKNYFSVFGLFEGDVNKTRLKNLSFINPYLNENILIRNEETKFNLTGGVKGTLASNVGYKAAVSYKTIGNFHYFVNDTTRKETFNVEYEEDNTNILSLTGEVNIQFSKAFRLDGKVELNDYELKNELNAWQYPGIKLTAIAGFNIADKLRLNADLYFQGDSKAKVYSYGPVVGTDPAPLITDVRTLKAFADFGLGADYQINKNFGAFVRADNLLGNKYQRYLYYPGFGFNFIGGVSYSF